MSSYSYDDQKLNVLNRKRKFEEETFERQFSNTNSILKTNQYDNEYTISNIRFTPLNGSDIGKSSNIELVNRELYFPPTGDNPNMHYTDEPFPKGAMDWRLGLMNKNGGGNPNDDNRCYTCQEVYDSCSGHFGWVQLALPVFNIGYIGYIHKILQSICKTCSRLILPTVEMRERFLVRARKNKSADLALKKAQFRQIVDECKKVKFCPFCQAYNGNIRKGNSVGKYMALYHDRTTGATVDKKIKEDWLNSLLGAATTAESARVQSVEKANEELTPKNVLELFKRIPAIDAEILCITNPESLIFTHFPAIPKCLRPTVSRGDGDLMEDDLTHQLSKIIMHNNGLQKRLEIDPNPRSIAEDWSNLQVQVSLLINSDASGLQSAAAAAAQASGGKGKAVAVTRNIRSLCTRLKGKEGRFRGNLSGKRVDFTARTVISPDPNVRVNQVVVPIDVAKILTYPERVCTANIKRLKRHVLNGRYRHPGAAYVQFQNDHGRKRDMGFQFGEEKLNEMSSKLDIGDIVERHLTDGDIVLFNRQPSLHRMSVMAHQVKVLPGRTFRFNECVCAPYNADFDGDEMNMHLPQTDAAKAEAFHLMGVQNNLTTPKSGEPVVAATQDFLTSAFVLTQREVFFTREEVCQAVGHIAKGCERIDLHPPAIIKPVELWTGKQIFSMLLRPNSSCANIIVNLQVAEKNYSRQGGPMCPYDGYVYFVNSELLAGNLGKKTLGESKPGLFFNLIRDNSSQVAAICMSRLSRLSAHWFNGFGFTFGLNDVKISPEVEAFRQEQMKRSFALVAEKIGEFENGTLQLKAGCDASQTLEALINGELGRIRNIVGEKCEELLPLSNKPRIMATCGSKGSAINLSQMMVCVGQQNVGGARIVDCFANRSLPHFKQYAKDPASRGFVSNSFYTGLEPTEFFFHTMGGREGLVDTAVKTADTGYMNRRVGKALEDLSVKYDLTVRTSGNDLVQFRYGDDGLNPGLMEGKDSKPINFEHTFEHVKRLIGKPTRIEEEAKQEATKMSKKRRLVDGATSVESDYLGPSEFILETRRYIEEMRDALVNYCPSTTIDCSKFLEGLETFLLDQAEQLRVETNIVSDLSDCSNCVSREQLEVFINVCQKKFKNALVEPGDVVGMLASQSMCEPATQMTLKTFHFAGVASMNVTLGVPRLTEIINATVKISTPIITASLDYKDTNNKNMESLARIVKGRIEKTLIGDVCSKITENFHPNDGDGYVLELHINQSEIDRKFLDINIHDIQQAITSSKGKLPCGELVNALIVDVVSDHSIGIKFPTNLKAKRYAKKSIVATQKDTGYSWFDVQHLKYHLLPKLVITGVSTVKNVVINRKERSEEFELLAEGSGLAEILLTNGVDYTRTNSNHIMEVEEVLGIEAARASIMDEVKKIMGHHGISIDSRHMSMLAECMTSRGKILGITRFGIAKMKSSTLMLASFEQTNDHLFESAAHNVVDPVSGVSESIILGQPLNMGTGLFDLLPDPDYAMGIVKGGDDKIDLS